MNTDIRLDVNFYDHPKTKKLIRRAGYFGVIALQRLWLYAAKFKCDGMFTSMDEEDITIVAGCDNDSLTLVTTLVELNWMEFNDGVYSLHDWVEHNGYASSSDDRSDKSRFSRMAKTHPEIYKKLKLDGINAIDSSTYKQLTSVQRFVNSVKPALTNASSPLPPPLPSPSINKEEDRGRGCERMSFSEIQKLHVDYLGKIPHSQPVVSVLQDICREYPPDRIRKAFKAVAAAEKPNLNWIKTYLDNPNNWRQSNANGKGNPHNIGATGNSGRSGASDGSEGAELYDEETIAFCSRDWPEPGTV